MSTLRLIYFKNSRYVFATGDIILEWLSCYNLVSVKSQEMSADTRPQNELQDTTMIAFEMTIKAACHNNPADNNILKKISGRVAWNQQGPGSLRNLHVKIHNRHVKNLW